MKRAFHVSCNPPHTCNFNETNVHQLRICLITGASRRLTPPIQNRTMASSSQHEENTFFVKERDRLTAEITSVRVLAHPMPVLVIHTNILQSTYLLGL